ncbi:hypothetical protein BGX21_001664 [Mortierella sp. AD011]|nr:hypothetical protein BGX21_001664 [Mortierella sp. AD011]
MVSMINDTKITEVIPDAIDGRVYTPRTFDYEIGCSNIDISLTSGTGSLALGDTACARTKIITVGDFYYTEDGANVTKRSNDRWSISMPVEYIKDLGYVSELPMFTETTYNNSTCTLSNYMNGLLNESRDGSTSSPTTVATKCVYPSGDVVAMSLSTSRFMTTTASQFSNVSKIMFDEYDELFQTMDVALDTITGSNSTLFLEIKSENGTTNSLSCYKAPNPSINNTSFLSCIYFAAQSTILKIEAFEPVITSAQRGSQPLPDITTIMSFTHLVSIDKGFSAQISIAELRNHTLEAAHYLASLGQNLYVNWNRQEVTVMFETTDAEEGLEIPNWLIIFVPATAIISALLVGPTEYFLDARYTSSLYKSIALSMRLRMNSFAPMLMRSKVDPIEFEGIPVVPSGPQFEADPKSVATLKSENNSRTTLVNDKLFSDKLSFGNKMRF